MSQTARQMRVPDETHPITISDHGETVEVYIAGQRIARSDRALRLAEASYPPVFYIPREDVDMTALRRRDDTSYCPFKGDANYYDIETVGEAAEKAVWTYEAPYEAVAPIGDHLAFYTNKVEVRSA